MVQLDEKVKNVVLVEFFCKIPKEVLCIKKEVEINKLKIPNTRNFITKYKSPTLKEKLVLKEHQKKIKQ